MAEIVFVLGAGASAEAGAPVMRDFLDVAENIWLSGTRRPDAEHLARVFESIAALKSVQAQLTLDTYNLEDVFSAFEMGALTGRLGTISDAQRIADTRKAMVRLIARTLTDTVRLPVDRQTARPPGAYGSFVSLLEQLTKPQTKPLGLERAPAVITLNYDLALDYALHWKSVRYEYGLVDHEFPPSTIRLLKLHGSLNWGICPDCNKVVPWILAEYLRSRTWNLGFGPDTPESVILSLADHLHEYKHCQNHLSDEPVVVPPSWNKGDRVLGSVWQHAARELSEARYLVFIGYSFPPTDLYFRYLLALGLASDTRIRRIVVLNLDKSVHGQLNKWLSPALQSRVEFVPKKFSEGIADLHTLLDVRAIPL